MTIFIPTVLDPEVAPEGKHIIHVYTAGSEPYDIWKERQRGTKDYEDFKRERAEILWETIERIIPDIRERVEVEIYASPQTHQRFLRRHKGTYGPALQAGGNLFDVLPLPNIPQPGVLTPIPKLLRCGDSVFPGVGVPAVAASGAIAASTLAPLPDHLKMMWDVSQTQNNFWQKQGGREKWLRETEKPFHPSEGGGAEHMDPSEYYKAAADKMKVTGNMKPSGLESASSSAVSK